MTTEQENKCHAIIHTASAAAGVTSIVPVPGVDIAMDVAAMTTMAISLASVFGKDLTSAAARGVAYAALKKVIVKNPTKYAVKSVAKYIPLVGSVFSATISVALTEAAGWQLAKEFDAEGSTCRAMLP